MNIKYGLLILIFTNVYANKCMHNEEIEKILNKNSTKIINLNFKSTKGWLRVLNNDSKMHQYGITIDDKTKELIINKINSCIEMQNVGRMK